MDKGLYEKLCNYCAYQERCVADVRQKMQKLKMEKDQFDLYIEKLKEENFLNEDRFVKYFVSAHSKKKWGKTKIKAALGAKRVNAEFVKKYLEDIDEGAYAAQIAVVAAKRWRTIKGDTVRERKIKLMRFLLSKGYEMAKVQEAMKFIN